MEKEFVPYELAVKLKELGFDEPCFAFYQEEYKTFPIMVDDDEQYRLTGYRTCKNSEIPEHYTSVPIFSQAFRWFREKYGLCGYVSPFEDASAFDFMIYTNINKPYANRICSLPDKWKTYEEAELACLDKLIEIVEKK